MSIGLGTGMRSRLSVIIPAYNYAHFLAACLRSVLAQTIADLEVLVVDDGSEDDTSSVVAAFPRVRYVHQANQGLSAARNTGLTHSSGEYVLFLDADDLLAPDSLAPRLAFLRDHRATGLSVCRTRQFSRSDDAGNPTLGAPWLLPPDDLELRLLYFNIAPPHAWLLHRSVADAVGLFDTGLRACEDYDYWLRALALGHDPLYSPAGMVYYRKHVASMSADNRNQLHHDVLLHERVFEALHHHRQMRASDPACALLAAWAGAYTTLSRLAATDNPDYERLLALLARPMDKAPLASTAAVDPRRVLRDYYLLKLLSAARHCARRDSRVSVAFDALWDSLGNGQIVTGKVEALRAPGMLGRLILDHHAPLIDRYRVLRLLFA